MKHLFLISAYLCLVFPCVQGFEPDCELIDFSTLCRIDGKKLIHTDTIIIQINNRNGEVFSNVDIPFSSNCRINNLSGQIEDTKGHIIRLLKNRDIINVSAISDYSLYNDDNVRKFTLKHNTYPYRIRYTYTTISKQFLMIADWNPVFNLKVPTRHATLTVLYPPDYRLNISEHAIDPPKDGIKGNMLMKTWSTSYDGLMDNEVYAPAQQEWIPNVKIVPLSFTYGVEGNTESWGTYGNWQSRLLQGQDKLPEEELWRIRDLISRFSDRQEAVRSLYHYLQDNTRYINVSIDIGGMKPYPADYVSVNKYGDCKALTNYMMALLNAAGIPSYYTIVYRDIQPWPVLRSLPGPQFNHVLLTVPLEKDTIWLENTDNTNPFGYLGITNQNRDALLIEGDKSHIIRLPAMAVHDVLETGSTEYLLSITGSTRVLMSHTYRGYGFEQLNDVLNKLNPQQQHDFIDKHTPGDRLDLITCKMIKPGRDDRQIRLVAYYNQNNAIRSIGKEYYFSVQPLDLPKFASPVQRKLPVQLSYAIASQDTLIYHLPQDFINVGLPDSVFHKSRYGFYKAVYTRNNNDIILSRSFQLNPGRYMLSEYTELYNFIKAVKNEDKAKIMIRQL